jgi:hypothetical protein
MDGGTERSGWREQVSAEAQPDLKITGYCRVCGKALTEVSVRSAQGTIYCEDHVPQESTTTANSSFAGPFTPPADSPYAQPMPPPMPDSASPGTAFVLGMIPGVGAIYNRQYAKGIVHVIILAMLIMAADNGPNNVGPLFGLSIMGFWFYMAFEAFHTAQNRQRGIAVDEFSSLMPTAGGSRFPIVPILLIAFGGVFLLDTLEIYDLRRLMRFWPILMIGMGIYLLYARMKDSGPRPPDMPGGLQ